MSESVETVESRMRRKLVAEFSPTALEIVDESEMHRGHSGWREGGQTHFRVTIEAAAFAEMGRIARQRAVYACLSEELAGPVHALALKVRAPAEAE